MDLFAKVDAMRIDSDEDDSDLELDAAAVMNDDAKQQRLVFDFDMNYDITDGIPSGGNMQVLDQEGGKKLSQLSASNSESNLQFDHRNNDDDDDEESYDDLMQDEERAQLSQLNRDSDLLDDKDILEMQNAQSILESCGLGSSGPSKKHNFRPSGMSLGFESGMSLGLKSA